MSFGPRDHVDDDRYGRLPFSVRSIVSSMARRFDDYVQPSDLEKVLNYYCGDQRVVEEEIVLFKPTRLLFQNFSGLPSFLDMASIRQVLAQHGHNVLKAEPSVAVDIFLEQTLGPTGEQSVNASTGLTQAQEAELGRCRERFMFLRWASHALENVRLVPPGCGIVHQTALESLARLCVSSADGSCGSDVVVGVDSHIAMYNGLGTLAWGVTALEAEAAMLNFPISLTLPRVVGCRLIGEPPMLVTATDLVLAITKFLRRKETLAAKIVEFFGGGVRHLGLADRMSISNMADEYGAIASFFPIDQVVLDHFQHTASSTVSESETFLHANHLVTDGTGQGLAFDEVFEFDLSEIAVTISGPQPSMERTNVAHFAKDFTDCLERTDGPRALRCADPLLKVSCEDTELSHGTLLVASVSSCTNGSHPSTMLTTGLLARNALERGLSVSKFTHACLSTGSGMTAFYLKEGGVLKFLEQAGFVLLDRSSTSGSSSTPTPLTLVPEVAAAVSQGGLVATSVFSSSRGNDCCGMTSDLTKARYITSPPLVVALALAGRANIDLAVEPLGKGSDGKDVFLKDIWPPGDETRSLQMTRIHPSLVRDVQQKIAEGPGIWTSLPLHNLPLYMWEPSHSYIQRSPFAAFKPSRLSPSRRSVHGAHCLLYLGDGVTADLISPAGNISRNSVAARYMSYSGLLPRMFNSYGSRIGNHAIMARGVFSHKHLKNKLVSRLKSGPKTVFVPSGEEMEIYGAAERYANQSLPVIIIAGHQYGCGSTREWAAKGLVMLGVRAVLAETFDPFHRTNLASVGVLPLQFLPWQNSITLGLTGRESFTIRLSDSLRPRQKVDVQVNGSLTFQVELRLDNALEIEYFCHDGMVNYALSKLLCS